MLKKPPLLVTRPHLGSLLARADASHACNFGSNTSAFGLSLSAPVDDLANLAYIGAQSCGVCHSGSSACARRRFIRSFLALPLVSRPFSVRSCRNSAMLLSSYSLLDTVFARFGRGAALVLSALPLVFFHFPFQFPFFFGFFCCAGSQHGCFCAELLA